MGSCTQLSYQIVFGTKHRHPTITPDLREELYKYVGGVIRNKEGSAIEIGGVAHHIHIFTGLPSTVAVADMVRDIKSNSSAWAGAKTKDRWEWQIGYGAFTVSYSLRDKVATYVRNQEEHHRVKSFQEEYVELLTKHGIKFDMKYLFEGEHHG